MNNMDGTTDHIFDFNGDTYLNNEALLIKRAESPRKIEFRSEGGKYAILDMDAGTVESNIPRDEQIGVIVDALEQLGKAYGIL